MINGQHSQVFLNVSDHEETTDNNSKLCVLINYNISPAVTGHFMSADETMHIQDRLVQRVGVHFHFCPKKLCIFWSKICISVLFFFIITGLSIVSLVFIFNASFIPKVNKVAFSNVHRGNGKRFNVCNAHWDLTSSIRNKIAW